MRSSAQRSASQYQENMHLGLSVPGKHPLDPDHQVVSIGSDGLEESCRLGGGVTVHQDLAFLIEDAAIHFVGVEVDSTGVLVLLGVQSQEKASLAKG